LTDSIGRLIFGLFAPLILVIEQHGETIPVLATPMRVQEVPQRSRFMFWCTAPFLVATLVILPLVAQPPEPTGWVVMGVVELLALFVLIGFWNPERFWWCWRAVGAIVFLVYLAYLISMVVSGQWFGNGRRSSSTAFNALIGLIIFGYPGFMYAVFGRFTWRPEPELEDYSDEWFDIEE
jgi:hypothetical protein